MFGVSDGPGSCVARMHLSAGPGGAHMDCPAFTLTLPSELRMLSVARTFVEAVCQAQHLDRTLIHSLVLVTGEAFTNIVRHAHRDIPQAQMEIRLQLFADAVSLTFQDEGAPFNLAAVPELAPGELRIGGRGVFLMRTLMDEISCEPRTDQAGNRLRMLKRLRPLAAGA
jgi:serine/threonine-protein kinase RsbW